jgi:phenylpropionate dioxygenase-like ring-hydroxylating dioxygenase large terminal subunit
MANTLNRMEAFWFPLCPSNLLNQKTALAYTVLGRHLVVWASANGTIGALEDRCSHRSARLSQGEIHSDGLLSCPYHGWRFDPSGQCRARPQCPDQTISPSCRVTSYAASVRYGYVWVKLDCSSQMCIPDFPESDDTPNRRISRGVELLGLSPD